MVEAEDKVKLLPAVTIASDELSIVTALATVRLAAGVRELLPNSKAAILKAPVPEKIESAIKVILVEVLRVKVPPETVKSPPRDNVVPLTSKAPSDISRVLPKAIVPAVLVI